MKVYCVLFKDNEDSEFDQVIGVYTDYEASKKSIADYIKKLESDGDEDYPELSYSGEEASEDDEDSEDDKKLDAFLSSDRHNFTDGPQKFALGCGFYEIHEKDLQ